MHRCGACCIGCLSFLSWIWVAKDFLQISKSPPFSLFPCEIQQKSFSPVKFSISWKLRLRLSHESTRLMGFVSLGLYPFFPVSLVILDTLLDAYVYLAHFRACSTKMVLAERLTNWQMRVVRRLRWNDESFVALGSVEFKMGYRKCTCMSGYLFR